MVTDGLVLAAGFGSRLRDFSPSKPLTRVCGRTLLDLAVTQLVRAGVARIVVVTGHEADLVEGALPGLSEQCGVELVPARLADWTRPNGYSVLAGAALLQGEYLLVMADHIFSAKILPALANAQVGDNGALLAIDRRLDSALIDPSDATYVRLNAAGGIREIRKELAEPDAVDCGAFRATPALAQAIAEAIDAGRPGSLSDGMQVLADRGAAATLDIGDAWWIDVDDRAAHNLAQAQAPVYLADVLAMDGTTPKVA